MTAVFADTVYYLALLNPRDQHAAAAAQFTSKYSGTFVTTAWVLTEVANTMTRGANRALFAELHHDLASDRRVLIVPPSQDLFLQGIEHFAQRSDKDWSLTDCISFLVMRRHELTDALTADHHFRQAGFHVLLERGASG